ncbi:hypothetical protein I6A84_39180 [Frankia sp. CNm7]|uniref:CdaR GGDEF-like domain-containing protein n=1 Tax=Frankia nepalensis TaxID=1836974 RepID=A0A937RR42_9ACTN|nr:hypothetical protein [Frankia nepalensis]MBL7510577.1 hypothetical protein [Frankia nepalensis]MBL7523910.1 hypothetical protein [Frankia nepalensis]MBL7633364.1 hypothetical protein [Frankia nepalensis]
MDPAQLEADLVAAALDGAEWPELLAQLAAAVLRPVRLLDMAGNLLAASDQPAAAGAGEADRGAVDGVARGDARGRGSSAVAIAALLVAPSLGPVISAALGRAAAPVVCRDGWRGHGAPVRMGNRYLGALLIEADLSPAVCPDSAGGWACQLVAAASTALAIVAVRREAHAAALARRVDVVLDDIRHGAIRPAAEFVRVAESFGLDVTIPHAGVALRYMDTDLEAWAAAWGPIGFPVLREGERAWTLLSGDVPAELSRLCSHLAYQLGSPRAVLAAAGPAVPGDPVDPAETAASFRSADAVLALLRTSHERDPEQERSTLLFDELGLERLLLGVPAEKLRAFAERVLAGLDPAGVDLLSAYLETDGSLEAVAARLDAQPARLRRRLPALIDDLTGARATTSHLTDLHAATLAHHLTAATSPEA